MDDNKVTRSCRGPAGRTPTSMRFYLEVGDAIGGRYEIVRLLGAGGMGAVYEVNLPASGERAALKLLAPELCARPSYAERFAREARVAASLNHPNLIKVRDDGQHDERPFLVMDFIDGETLEARIADGRLSTLAEAQGIAAQVGAGLDYLHSHGLIHRDIKAANIMVDGSGRATLLDFGVLRDVRDVSLTMDGCTVGTPGYMAPEQALGEATLDGRADQYALASVIFEVLTGRLPFNEAQDALRVRRQLSEPVPDVRQWRPDVPAPMAQALTRALASRAERRFPTAAAFAAALASDVEVPTPVLETPEIDLAPPAGSDEPQKRKWVGLATAAVLLAALLALVEGTPASRRWATLHLVPHAPAHVS
jgi:serine/threonine protein kinase